MADPGVSGFRLQVSKAEQQRGGGGGQDGCVDAMSEGSSTGQEASL